jgi:hypothetical protein
MQFDHWGRRMSESARLLLDARKSFRLASDAILIPDVERHGARGRDFLWLAHDAAKIDTIPRRRRAIGSRDVAAADRNRRP